MQIWPVLGPNPKWEESESLVVNLQFQYVDKNAFYSFWNRNGKYWNFLKIATKFVLNKSKYFALITLEHFILTLANLLYHINNKYNQLYVSVFKNCIRNTINRFQHF